MHYVYITTNNVNYNYRKRDEHVYIGIKQKNHLTEALEKKFHWKYSTSTQPTPRPFQFPNESNGKKHTSIKQRIFIWGYTHIAGEFISLYAYCLNH